MSDALLEGRNLVKHFGSLVVTDDASLSVALGQCHAVIGPNGAGKTTLIAQLSGELLPDAGNIYFAGREITKHAVYARARLGIARSFQVSSLFNEFTALQNIAIAVQAHAGHSFHFWRRVERENFLNETAQFALAEVGLSERADMPVTALAHGERRALEIAMVLAMRPRLLLLDEPMAGMGPEDSMRIIKLLLTLKGRFSILLVEHDMDAVFALADVVTVLVLGRTIVTGTPQEIRGDVRVREAYLGEEEVGSC